MLSLSCVTRPHVVTCQSRWWGLPLTLWATPCCHCNVQTSHVVTGHVWHFPMLSHVTCASRDGEGYCWPNVCPPLCRHEPSACVLQTWHQHTTAKQTYKTGPKFTDDLRTILWRFSDLRQSCDNWRIHRTFTTVLRPILRQNLTIIF